MIVLNFDPIRLKSTYLSNVQFQDSHLNDKNIHRPFLLGTISQTDFVLVCIFTTLYMKDCMYG